MTTSVNRQDPYRYLFYFLLFLSVVLRPISPFSTPICFAIIIILQLPRTKFKIPGAVGILAIIFVLFYINSQLTGFVTTANVIWYAIPSILGIIIGYNTFITKSNTSYYNLFDLLYVLAFSLAILNIFITVIDIYQIGLINPGRKLSILSGDDEVQTITSRTIELSLAISGISMLFFRNSAAQKNIVNLYIITGVLAELCTLHYVSRTGIAILLVSIIIGLIYRYKLSLKFLLILLTLIAVTITFIADSELYEVFAAREQYDNNIYDAGGRTERWAIGFDLLMNNWYGYQSSTWYAHNFWLDFGRDGGFIPFILLAIFSLYILYTSLRIQGKTFIPDYVRYNILLFSIIFFIAFFTEPVHTGTQISMYYYFIFCGIVLKIKALK